jgi:hypothetical protein
MCNTAAELVITQFGVCILILVERPSVKIKKLSDAISKLLRHDASNIPGAEKIIPLHRAGISAGQPLKGTLGVHLAKNCFCFNGRGLEEDLVMAGYSLIVKIDTECY